MQATSIAKLKHLLPTTVQTLLRKHDRNAIVSRQELATLLKLPPRTAYGKIEKCAFDPAEYSFLVRTLAERGDYTLLNIMLPEGSHVINHKCTCINGRLEDDSQELFKKYGAACELFDNGDYDGASRVIREAESVLVNAKQEIENRIKLKVAA